VVYYSDTDSALIDRTLYVKLMEQGMINGKTKIMGKLEKEFDVKYYASPGAKEYILISPNGQTKFKVKGIRKNDLFSIKNVKDYSYVVLGYEMKDLSLKDETNQRYFIEARTYPDFYIVSHTRGFENRNGTLKHYQRTKILKWNYDEFYEHDLKYN